MKIALVGESPVNPSGFGQQMLMLSEGFQAHNHDVVCVSLAYNHAAQLPNIQEWRLPNILDIEAVDDCLYRIDPDVVICFWHTHGISQFIKLKWPPNNAKVFYWLPWEGTSLPQNADDAFGGVRPGSIVHLSNYAKELWKDITPDSSVVPHGVSSSIFTPPDVSRCQLRRELSDMFSGAVYDDDLLVLNVDRNIWHKRWDATFDFVSKLQDRTNKRVRLLAHTKRVEDSPSPVHGYNLPELERDYKLDKGTVLYTDFDWHRGVSRKDLCKMYQSADVRISTSEGEGFGIPTIEAAMCRCPQVLNGVTTIPELLGQSKEPNSFWQPPAMSEMVRNVKYEIPHVNSMVDRAERVLNADNEFDLQHQLDSVRKHVLSNYESEVVIQKWLSLIDATPDSSDQCTATKYGFTSDSELTFHATNLANVSSKLEERPEIIEVGCQGGKFVSACLSLGVRVAGLDIDDSFFDQYSGRVREYVRTVEPFTEWPTGNIVVITDSLSTVSTPVCKKILGNAVKREWIVLRRNSLYMPNHKVLDTRWISAILERHNCQRRFDMEKIARAKWDKNFSHEIWQTHLDNSDLPEAFC